MYFTAGQFDVSLFTGECAKIVISKCLGYSIILGSVLGKQTFLFDLLYQAIVSYATTGQTDAAVQQITLVIKVLGTHCMSLAARIMV